MKIIRPRAELRPYVRYYWILESGGPSCTLTFPFGCTQMIFHRKTPLYIPETGAWQDSFTVSGQVNFPAHVCSYGPVEMITAVFRPHTIGMFAGIPPSEFYNMEISGFDIGSRSLSDLAQRICDAKSHSACIGILEDWLLSRLQNGEPADFRRMESAVGKILDTPVISVEALADDVCLGRKQFGRIFREHAGMNPKEYMRVVRFQRAMRMMQCGRRDYAGMAADCGYADQSHFIREFKAMGGHTPFDLPKHCIPYSDLFTCPV